MGNEFAIVLITHGKLSEGFKSSLKVILDINDDIMDTLTFEVGESLEEFKDDIAKCLNEKHKGENAVILMDLPGGSPSNVALSFFKENRKFIAGINLPLVLELTASKLNGISFEELDIREIVNNAKQSVVYYNDLIEQKEGN